MVIQILLRQYPNKRCWILSSCLHHCWNSFWNRTYTDVVTPAGIYYFWNVKDTDAYLGQYLITYTTTVTTNAACSAIVGARCSDWLKLYPGNNTVAGVPPALAF